MSKKKKVIVGHYINAFAQINDPKVFKKYCILNGIKIDDEEIYAITLEDLRDDFDDIIKKLKLTKHFLKKIDLSKNLLIVDIYVDTVDKGDPWTYVHKAVIKLFSDDWEKAGLDLCEIAIGDYKC